MAQPITPDYGQQFLFPPALEDWVSADHPARFLREFVDQLDLRVLGFVLPAAVEGRLSLRAEPALENLALRLLPPDPCDPQTGGRLPRTALAALAYRRDLARSQLAVALLAR